MLQSPYRLRSSYISTEVLYISEQRWQFKNSHEDYLNTIKYSMWITYDSIRNDNTLTQVADFKFSHNFIICHKLPKMELLLGIDVQKKFSLSYTCEKNCYIQKEGRFLKYTRNCEQKANAAVVKSALKIPRLNGIIPIKIKGHVIKGHMAYFISDTDSRKGKDPNIHIIDGIHNIKGKNICSCSHFKLHQQKHHLQQWGICRTSRTTYRRHATDSRRSRITNNPQYHHRKDDGQEGWTRTFKPPCHKLRKDIETKLEELL